jgi:hypothetical protein
MTTLLGKWWTGVMLMTVGSAPWVVTRLILFTFEPPHVNGLRPLWWRISAFTICCMILLPAPILVRYKARQIIQARDRHEGRPSGAEQHV